MSNHSCCVLSCSGKFSDSTERCFKFEPASPQPTLLCRIRPDFPSKSWMASVTLPQPFVPASPTKGTLQNTCARSGTRLTGLQDSLAELPHPSSPASSHPTPPLLQTPSPPLLRSFAAPNPCSPVLEPDLDDPHVESGLDAELLAHVTRRLRTLVVGALQRLQLLRRDGRARPLVAVVYVVFCAINEGKLRSESCV